VRRAVVFSVIAVLVMLIAVFAVNHFSLIENEKEHKPFYVGVTFGGNNTTEAKMLIDKVKDYTNMFVLQSGPLMRNETAVKEIGDYAVANGLRFAAFFESGALFPPQEARWLGTAEEQWGGMFAGVYFGDEKGGKMLDAHVHLSSGVKLGTGGLQVGNTTYLPNGTITVSGTTGMYPDPSFYRSTNNSASSNGAPDIFESNQTHTEIKYFPDGSITIEESVILSTYYSNGSITINDRRDSFYTMENGTDRISQVESYEEVLSRHPIPNCDAVAEEFAGSNRKLIDDLVSQWQLSNRSFPIFTADYALYWWVYQSGYDLVLAELGWNNTVEQEIGLVRGAAGLQGKRWGTIITWKYTHPPYLTSGDEMFEQMRMSYESGAEYVIVFNYSEDMEGPYGTLRDEHFEALERFWKNVVQSTAVVHGGIKAEVAFVFPKNYGWGLRRIEDSVWGLWEPTSEAKQAWSFLQDVLANHGLRLDIVYDDVEYLLAGKYRQVYYWNQTS
jgi:hypothetical protein